MLIAAYIAVMVIVTVFTTGLRGLVFGGRYDFAFLIVFWILYHGSVFLTRPISHYIKLFLWSGGIVLVISGLLKFPFSEEWLLYLGYSPSVSAWDFGGAPPIFHGIDGASVRRFQGLLDGPNTMGAFILLYLGLLIYYFRYKKEWYFVIGLIATVLIGLLSYTYSRSAMLGLFGGAIVALAGGLVILWRHYKKQTIALGVIVAALLYATYIGYTGRGDTIIGREGSTKGHAERMMVGVNRFLEHPMGQGLGSAGPAYRHVYQLHSLDRADVEAQDRFYIPESWFIQQYIEGGILGGTLFLLIMAIMFFSLFGVHSVLAGMFGAIGIMNLFLHTYESSVISLLLFSFVGLLLYEKKRISSRKH